MLRLRLSPDVAGAATARGGGLLRARRFLGARAATNRKDELGELANSFNQMADRIQTLLAAERRLLLDISHELRSPLARLSVAVELARSGEDREHMLDRIQKEADRLNELVAELLQVTRVEGDPRMQKHDSVRLDELLADLVYDSLLEAKAKDCTLLLKAPVPVTLNGDEELLRRAIENVIRNAIRYAPRDTSVDIELEKSPADCADLGPRLWARRPRRIPAADFRSVLSRGFRPQPHQRRPGPGPGDRPALSGAAQGQAGGAERESGTAGDHRASDRADAPRREPSQTTAAYSGFNSLMVGRQREQASVAFGCSPPPSRKRSRKIFSPLRSRSIANGHWIPPTLDTSSSA